MDHAIGNLPVLAEETTGVGLYESALHPVAAPRPGFQGLTRLRHQVN